MPRFTALERAVMEALAWDLRDVAPDLAGQFEESLPGQRRNTGLGLFTEMIVSNRRPAAAEQATGAYGTVHAMVGDLPDPIAFKVQLRDGRLLALEGDSYGQDTRGIDFAAVAFDPVFTVDHQGRSIEFDPRASMKPSPLLELQRQDDAPGAVPPPPLVNTGALQRVQETATRPVDLLSAIFGARLQADAPALAPDAPLGNEDRKSLLVAVWVGIGVAALLIALLLRVPLVYVLGGGFVLARIVGRPAILNRLGRAARNLGRYSVRPRD